MMTLKRSLILVFMVIGALLIGVPMTLQAQEGGDATPTPRATTSPLHPTFAFLDAAGANVLTSGEPVSTTTTCGECHDTEFITNHSFHADVGLSSLGETTTRHPWDSSSGYFGRWDAITYAYLSQASDSIIDQTTVNWIMQNLRHVGGGPALTSRAGTPLTALPAEADAVETSVINPQTGELENWDWAQSGSVEMDCFLCHLDNPNNSARIASLQAGEFAWSNTATLIGTGILDRTGGEWVWNPEAFDADGNLTRDYLTIQDPTSENCGQCHGAVHSDPQTPLVVALGETDNWSTLTTGQIFSAQHIANSGMNYVNKADLTRTYDVHAERVLECVDCHYALNNPVYYQESADKRPEHLVFDPRRLDFGEYIYRPLHEFAKGQSSYSDLAPQFDNSLRRCESCHDAEASHTWLPYQERHTSALACETCHIPELYGAALQAVDWTVLTLDSEPRQEFRGVDGELTTSANTLLKGYEPLLLPRENEDGTTSLAPYNLVSAWYWVYVENGETRPVPLRYLQEAWFDGSTYAPAVLAMFDTNHDGTLNSTELLIDNDAKADFIAERLTAQGLENPHIVGEVSSYDINHNVTNGEWATRDCQTCHSDDSRIMADFTLANQVPNGIIPKFLDSTTLTTDGKIQLDDNGKLYYQPAAEDLYILGHDKVALVDWFGALALVATLLVIAGHSTLRYLSARRHPSHIAQPVREEYMYGVYERQWHWLQTALIIGLLFTGLIIHKPELFGVFSFRYIVQLHNVLALILVINAALAAFYHLASGEIRQFIPQPRNFFTDAFRQARFYTWGIFRGEPHPFAKSAEHKMNPLQQLTYLAILNILLPLQVITGALMWGAQRYPEFIDTLGGLSFLAPLHTLVAWLFVTFIVAHVYLTTTGHTPLAGIRAMMFGWDDVEEQPMETLA